MKRLYLFLFFVQLGYSQDDSLSFNPDSLETANVSTDTLSQVSAESISAEPPNGPPRSRPRGSHPRGCRSENPCRMGRPG